MHQDLELVLHLLAIWAHDSVELPDSLQLSYSLHIGGMR